MEEKEEEGEERGRESGIGERSEGKVKITKFEVLLQSSGVRVCQLQMPH